MFALRKRYLTQENIKEILKQYTVEFVVADVGLKLEWVGIDKSFDFWKTELKPHLITDLDNIAIENFPNNYAYIASEWIVEIETPIILLEKCH